MNLKRGINLGGFLSQCCHEQTHYDTFIVKEDIQQIAAWGFDHVRLPIDYNVLETEDATPIQSGYDKVADIISWCNEYHLNIILDLHKAYGYDFNDAGNADTNNLFTDESLQQRFVNLWIRIAQNYSSCPNVAFELLNEVVEKENASLWNTLIQKTVSAIREISSDIKIIYGGIQWNSVKTLKLLDIPKDENIIFTFHFYEPLLFTHQKAYWVKNMNPTKDIFYPESMNYYAEKSKVLGYQGEVVAQAVSKTMGTEFIREMIQEAIDAAKNAGVSLYCGEFGVINQAPTEDTLRWFKDIDQIFREFNIGCSVWTYKEMDFGLTEKHYEPIRKDLLSLWLS